MGPDDEKGGEDPNYLFTPEQISLIIVMGGFAIMGVGIYITREILSIFLDVGMVIVVIGALLYVMFIYSRIYVMEHIPVPIPEALRQFLRSGAIREGISRPAAPRPAMRPAGVARPRIPPASFPTKGPVGAVTTAVGLDILEEIAPSVRPVRAGPVPAPRPAQVGFVDVLEEADKEFERYIDKLIEE